MIDSHISLQKKENFKVIDADVVRAKQFELVGPLQRLRMLATVVDDEVKLILCDWQGERRLEIKAGKSGGAEIQLLGDESTTRLALALSKKGIATIALLNAEGKPRFMIEADALGVVDISPKP